MARKGNRQLVKLVNPDTGTFYVTSKNRVNTPDKMEIMKFDKKIKQHAKFIEKKIK